MKKSISKILASAFAIGLLAACSPAESKPTSSSGTSVQPSTSTTPGVKTITSVGFSGLASSQVEGATINWAGFRVVVGYSDSTSLSISDIEFDVESASLETTKAIVSTSGLHTQSTLEVGSYELKAKLAEEEYATEHTLGTVSVTRVYDIHEASHFIIEYTYPDFISSYLATKEDFGNTSPEKEDHAFILDEDHADPYTVGTLNTFRFIPSAIFATYEAPSTPIVSDSYEKTWVVKVYDPVTGEKSNANTADYKIEIDGIKFNESAVGKKYQINVSPTEFTDEEPLSFDLRVESGLNIYDVKQLGALNLTHYSLEELYDLQFEEHAGRKGNNRRANGAEDVFWVSNGTEYNYSHIEYSEVWKSFLLEQHVFDEDEIAAYQDCKGVFLHDHFTLHKSDIPSDYFVVDGETGNAGNIRTGTFRDAAVVYAPIIDANDVTINGNYFSLSLEPGWGPCSNNWEVGPGKKFGAYAKEGLESVEPGHACLFKFCGRILESEDQYAADQIDISNGHKGIVKNINSLGDAKFVHRDDQDDVITRMLTVTAMIFAKNYHCGAEFQNSIIKEYQIALFGDKMVGQGVGSHEQVNLTFIKDTKIFDCSNCGVFNYHNGGISITNSNFQRFGGSAIMNAGCKDEDKGANTLVDSTTIFNNYVSGGEAYFSAMGAGGFVTPILGLDPLIQAYHGSGFIQGDKFNLAGLSVDGDGYVYATNGAVYSDFNISKGATTYKSSAFEGLSATARTILGTGAPIVTFDGSSNLDGSSKAYIVDPGTPCLRDLDNNPVPSILQGADPIPATYMTLYYPAGSTVLTLIVKLPA